MIGAAELARSTKLLAGYCQQADLNLRRSDEGWLLRKIGREPLFPIDTKPMRDALTEKSPQGDQHVVVLRFEPGGRSTPVGLQLLYELHSAIIMANAILLMEAKRTLSQNEHETLRDKWVRIYAIGAFLCELFRHAVTTIKDPQASLAVKHAIGLIDGPCGAAAEEALQARNAEHRDRLLKAVLAVGRLKNRSADNIARMLGDIKPVDLPGVMTWKDHDGARFINDTWFPAKYATPYWNGWRRIWPKHMRPNRCRADPRCRKSA